MKEFIRVLRLFFEELKEMMLARREYPTYHPKYKWAPYKLRSYER